jgi:hypothetical protein
LACAGHVALLAQSFNDVSLVSPAIRAPLGKQEEEAALGFLGQVDRALERFLAEYFSRVGNSAL